MIRLNRSILSLIVLVFCSINFLEAQQNLLDYENSIKFARYLRSSGQYSYAAQEYERLNFLWPDDTAIILEQVQTYRRDKQCDNFFSSYNLLLKNNRLYTNQSFAKEYLRFSLSCKIELANYFEISSLLPLKEEAFYNLSYYWVNRQYEYAFSYFKNNEDIINAFNQNLSSLTAEFEQQNYKKPGLALLMSTIIPGSGKAYSKRWGDAFVSLLFVSTNAYASYRAFNKKGAQSVNGWIFGGLAVSFYSANLWGSFKTAKKYNSELKLRYQNNAENIIYNSF